MKFWRRKMSDRLLELGIFAIGLFYPVVPKGKARMRVQISANHSKNDLAKAVAAFANARDELTSTDNLGGIGAP